MRPHHQICVRDEAPRDFVCAVAKVLAEHHQVFQVQLEPSYHHPDTHALCK
jgi:hypothetical protein